MSSQISEAHVKQFSANVFHLAQQKGSRLAPAVRNESQKGKSSFYDRIGAVTAIKKTSRHSDTPQIDTPHSRRRVTMVDYEWADLIEDQDKIRMLIDPANDYALAAMWALGRAKDDEIIENALGVAYSGEEGSTSVSFPDSQKVAANAATTTLSSLNVLTLRRVKKKFDANDVDENIKRYAAINSTQLESLLGETEVTSSDYASVKALVNGEVDSFMGFKFIRIERLELLTATESFDATGLVGSGGGTAAIGSSKCIFWAQDGLLLSTGKDVKGRISERDDKSYNTQVYACMSLGSTRMEEVKVVEVICAE
jgi:hypothetical protein